MKSVLTFCFFFFLPISFGQTSFVKPFELGEVHEIYSNSLQELRRLNIYFPPSYKENDTTRYPVIYLLDGSADEDFIHVVGLVNFLNYPWINKLPESIIVGIENVDRRRDFTFPTTIEKDLTDNPTSGHSDKFISFIENELIPFIETGFRTNDTNSLIGQSLGGLISCEILIGKPQLFDTYYIVSPSLWWDNESLIDKLSASESRNETVFIGVGEEGKVMIKDAKTLYKKLKKLCPKMTLHYEFFKEEDHGTILHSALYKGFLCLNNSRKSVN